MFRELFLLAVTLAVTGICLPPEAEACVGPVTEKLESETNQEIKDTITKGLGLFTDGKVDECKALVAEMSPENLDRFKNYYLIDTCEYLRPAMGVE